MLLTWRVYSDSFDALEMHSETHLLSPVWCAVEIKLLVLAASDRTTTTTTTRIPTR
jgi:hypothetical protein